MGTNQYPVPVSSYSTSTVLPVNASAVLADGEITSGTPYSTVVNGNGGIAYLVVNDNPGTVTIAGTAYTPTVGIITPINSVGLLTNVSLGIASTGPSTWKLSTMPYASITWAGITYGNGYFVAVAGLSSNSTVAAYSTDAINWTVSSLPSSSAWRLVTYGNGYFVAVAGGGSTAGAYSTNGTTWTASTLPTSQFWQGIGYGKIGATDYYVAVAYNTSNAAYSTNGTTWNAMTMPSSGYWIGVAYGNGYFVAIQNNGTTAGAYSTNGTTWTASTMSSADTWYGVAYGNGTFVATAGGTGTTAGTYSTNGITWTAMTMPLGNWHSITYGNGYFVSLSYAGGTGAYSTNGYTWSSLTMPTSNPWYSVAYGNGVFAATQADGVTANSAYFTYPPVRFGLYMGPNNIH